MAREYPPDVRMLIVMGLVLPDPDDWSDDFIITPAHCRHLFERLGIEATYEEEEDGWRPIYANSEGIGTVLLNAQAGGKDKNGKRLFASDFRLLGQLTGFTY